MTTSNYMKWYAVYPTYEIVEDQSIPEHFLKLPSSSLLKIGYRDGSFKYELDCTSGMFSYNSNLIKVKLNNTLCPCFPVPTTVLRPSQETTNFGVFQYKCATNDLGKTTSFVGTYNLGYRVHIDAQIWHQKLEVDGSTGRAKLVVSCVDVPSGTASRGILELN